MNGEFPRQDTQPNISVDIQDINDGFSLVRIEQSKGDVNEFTVPTTPLVGHETYLSEQQPEPNTQ